MSVHIQWIARSLEYMHYQQRGPSFIVLGLSAVNIVKILSNPFQNGTGNFSPVYTFVCVTHTHTLNLLLSCSIVTASTCLIMWNVNNSLHKVVLYRSLMISFLLKIEFLHCISMKNSKNKKRMDYLYNSEIAENYPHIHCMNSMVKWLHTTGNNESDNHATTHTQKN